MMRKIQSVLAAVAALVLLAACQKNARMDEAMLNLEDGFALEVSGTPVMNFSEGLCQMSYNEARKEFRIGDDKMADYYVITCDKVPSVKGEYLTAELSWTLNATLQKISSLKFQVEKIGDDGRIWLWDSKDKTAAIVYKPVF